MTLGRALLAEAEARMAAREAYAVASEALHDVIWFCLAPLGVAALLAAVWCAILLWWDARRAPAAAALALLLTSASATAGAVTFSEAEADAVVGIVGQCGLAAECMRLDLADGERSPQCREVARACLESGSRDVGDDVRRRVLYYYASPEQFHSGRRTLAAGWASVGVGAAWVLAGVVMSSLTGRFNGEWGCPNGDIVGPCGYDLVTPSAAAYAIGAGSVAAGVGLIVAGRRLAARSMIPLVARTGLYLRIGGLDLNR